MIPCVYVLGLEVLLQTESEKDLPDGLELMYWAGTESSLMEIHNFPGVIFATDGSKSSKGMGASTDKTLSEAAAAAGSAEAL